MRVTNRLNKDTLALVETKSMSPDKVLDKAIEQEKLDKEHLQNLFPDYTVTDEEVDEVNEVLKVGNSERFSDVLAMMLEHKTILESKDCPSLKAYCEAIKFISYTNAGLEVVDAYVKAKSTNKNIIENSMINTEDAKLELLKEALLFSKTKLVIKLQGMMDYPLHLLFAGYRYQAIAILRKEMNEAKMSRDRINAADKLLIHLQPQLEQIHQTNILINNNSQDKESIISTYRNALLDFAKNKRQLIENKEGTAEEVINIKVMESKND